MCFWLFKHSLIKICIACPTYKYIYQIYGVGFNQLLVEARVLKSKLRVLRLVISNPLKTREKLSYHSRYTNQPLRPESKKMYSAVRWIILKSLHLEREKSKRDKISCNPVACAGFLGFRQLYWIYAHALPFALFQQFCLWVADSREKIEQQTNSSWKTHTRGLLRKSSTTSILTLKRVSPLIRSRGTRRNMVSTVSVIFQHYDKIK